MSALLERTETGHPSIQRLAVDSVFESLRNPKSGLGFASAQGRDAVASCLSSRHEAVAGQAVNCVCQAVQAKALTPNEGNLTSNDVSE